MQSSINIVNPKRGRELKNAKALADDTEVQKMKSGVLKSQGTNPKLDSGRLSSPLMKTESLGIQKVSNPLREAVLWPRVLRIYLHLVGEETEGFKGRKTGPAVK